MILENKVLKAMENEEGDQLAYHTPTDTDQGVISDIHASIATLKTCSSEAFAFELSANTIDHFLVCNKAYKPPSARPSKIFFVSRQPRFWPTNYSTKEILHSYHNNKSIWQFTTPFENESGSNEDKEDVVEAIDDVLTHFTQINDILLSTPTMKVTATSIRRKSVFRTWPPLMMMMFPPRF